MKIGLRLDENPERRRVLLELIAQCKPVKVDPALQGVVEKIMEDVCVQ
jgi:hypothetical protein